MILRLSRLPTIILALPVFAAAALSLVAVGVWAAVNERPDRRPTT